MDEKEGERRRKKKEDPHPTLSRERERAWDSGLFPSPACGRGWGPPPTGGGRVRVFLFLNSPDQRLADDVDDAVEVAQDVIVPESEYLESFRFQKRGALGVPRFVMLSAVDLDDEHRVKAGEVGDVRQQAMLEAESGGGLGACAGFL
jgi:hypothetical protein